MSESSNKKETGGLKQDDFRKLLQTPRNDGSEKSVFGNFKTPRTLIKVPATPSRSSTNLSEQTPNPYLSETPKRRSNPNATPDSVYRDRAAERRRGDNPDYIDTEQILTNLNNTFQGPDMTPNSKLTYEQSKYLGGDEKHTHLVKGLDYALLAKQRSLVNDREYEITDEELEKLYYRKQMSEEEKSNEDQAMTNQIAPKFMTGLGERIHKAAFEPISLSGSSNLKNELFFSGRMAYIFELADEMGDYSNAFSIPTSLIRSRADIELEEDNQQSFKDPASDLVVSKICILFSNRRLGIKEPATIPTPQSELRSAPTEPAQKEEAIPQSFEEEEDDIFSDVDSDYELDLDAIDSERKNNSSISQSVEHEYFPKTKIEPAEHKSFEYSLVDIVKEASKQAANVPLVSNKSRSASPPPQQRSLFDELPNMDPTRRDYLRGDGYENDSNLMYGSSGSDNETLNDELEVMDEGTSKNKKKQLSRRDFNDEESWTKYKERQVHIPKAAFKFGVKMSDGRSKAGSNNDNYKKSGGASKLDPEEKLNREYQQLKSYMEESSHPKRSKH